MKDNQYLEEIYRRAVEKLTPDLVQGILQKKWEPMRTVEEAVRQDNTRTRHRRLPYYAGAFAAAAALFLTAFLFRGRAYAVIEIDVNPGVRLIIDDSCRILDAEGVNEEGREVLEGTELARRELEEGLAQVFSNMARQKYLTGDGDEILVSVLKKKADKGDLLDQAGRRVQKALEKEALDAAVYVQEVKKTAGLENLSREYHISLGKAQLISYLRKQDESVNAGELAQQPVHRLMQQVGEEGKTSLFSTYRAETSGSEKSGGKGSATGTGNRPETSVSSPQEGAQGTGTGEGQSPVSKEKEAENKRKQTGKREKEDSDGGGREEEDKDGNDEEQDEEDDRPVKAAGKVKQEDDEEDDRDEDGISAPQPEKAPEGGNTQETGQGEEEDGERPEEDGEELEAPEQRPPEPPGAPEPEREMPEALEPEEPSGAPEPEEPEQEPSGALEPEEPEQEPSGALEPEEPEQEPPEAPEPEEGSRTEEEED